MILDYIENGLQLLTTIIALLMCLFQYISQKNKGWVYLTAFFLASLMSCYYWTAYLVVMGDTPNVSSFISDSGSNIAFFILLLFVLRMQGGEEKRFYHPWMLLPIPLGIVQLFMYLPYGNVLINLYQVGILTAVSVVCLQSICWFRKNGRDGAGRPYVATAALLYVICEFGMWISSWLEPPYPGYYAPFYFVDHLYKLYYLFSIACSASYLYLVRALRLTCRSRQDDRTRAFDAKYQSILKTVCIVVFLIGCIGGMLLAGWMRSSMMESLGPEAESDIYDIIPVVLFIISLFLDAFAVVILFMVTFSQKVIENNELREARKAADHANAAKSEFLANMSHEIRTPINAVLGMNEIILRESRQACDHLPEDPGAIRDSFADIYNHAGDIQSAGNNLLSIINDILDFSKIEAGKLDIVENPYKLSSVLNDVSNMIVFKAREKSLDFHVDVDATLPDGLYGDEVRVRQVITNVLNNAVKYTRQGSVSLTVHEKRMEVNRVLLEVIVEDTGIGIRQEDIKKLFDKFERVDLRKNSSVEGTGLGLAITHNLLDMMGGGIDVKSVYGEGSVFTITLPQKVVSSEAIGDFREKFVRSLQETSAYTESFTAPQAHILVADDTRMNLTVVLNLLKHTGIQIDTAAGGEEAVRLARTMCYDLILMDQRMPGMDGTGAMRLIRGDGEGLNARTPFICLTADAVSGARERYLAEGFDDYLTKPIDSRALEKALMKYLPGDKVVIKAEDPPAVPEGADGGPREAPLEALAAMGVDIQAGLRYCGNDGEMYRTLLREYAQGAAESPRALRACREGEDWKGYAVAVHALKSTSRMIGATALSETAAGLEAAADAGRADLIGQAHDDMLARHDALVKAIVHTLGTEGDTAADDEILEFPPEGD